MPESLTPRHALPELFVGQAQKEITHNEALARIDALLHPQIEAILAEPPATLLPVDNGKCWVIAGSAGGIWAGKTGQIARWSNGSWRYLAPVEGMSVWHISESKRLFFIGGSWSAPGSIATPAGGAVIDSEGRAAISAILDHLRQISHIPS